MTAPNHAYVASAMAELQRAIVNQAWLENVEVIGGEGKYLAVPLPLAETLLDIIDRQKQELESHARSEKPKA